MHAGVVYVVNLLIGFQFGMVLAYDYKKVEVTNGWWVACRSSQSLFRQHAMHDGTQILSIAGFQPGSSMLVELPA